jgi:hypothetical protein
MEGAPPAMVLFLLRTTFRRLCDILRKTARETNLFSPDRLGLAVVSVLLDHAIKQKH